MICPHCGTENKPEDHFCEECGAQLIALETTMPDNGVMGPAVPTPGNETASPTEGLTPGTSLQYGRYRITKALGEGGMGTVLLANDTRLADKPTVVKVLYMVMDYVEGENLEHWLDRSHQPMKQEDALRYGLEVLDILEYLSKQQPAIVHRDIKPANLIIGAKDKHIHLVDFGIARANVTIAGKLHKTTALGTPGYAPPEQYQGYADPRSDLYALAATLHHMVTNRDPGEYAPFQFPPIRTLNPQLSPQLEQILIKALQTNASERYQTPQEMRQDLESMLAGTSILGITDSYKVSGTLPPRVLAPQSPRRPTGPASSMRDSFESLAQTAERTRQRQQTRESGYNDSDYYQSEQQSRFEQPRQIFEQQFEQPRQIFEQQSFRPYTPSRQTDENQLMWRFIIFIVAICAIGILAYFLFSSLHFFP